MSSLDEETAPELGKCDFGRSLGRNGRSRRGRREKAPDSEVFSLPPEMLFMNPLQFGFYSALARLDVEVDFAEVERGFI